MFEVGKKATGKDASSELHDTPLSGKKTDELSKQAETQIIYPRKCTSSEKQEWRKKAIQEVRGSFMENEGCYHRRVQHLYGCQK